MTTEYTGITAQSAIALTLHAMENQLKGVFEKIDQKIEWTAKTGNYKYNAARDDVGPEIGAAARERLKVYYKAKGFIVDYDSHNFFISWPSKCKQSEAGSDV